VVKVEPPLAPRTPELPDGLEDAELGDRPLGGLRLERVAIRGADLSDRAAPDLRLEEALLDGVLLDGTEAAGLQLTDVRVRGGSWAGLRTSRGARARR